MIIIKTIVIDFYLINSQYKLVVLAGLSGSGKSTLEFDILHKEGQRDVGK
jgi:excinuclease UvrABC ATPase subunit